MDRGRMHGIIYLIFNLFAFADFGIVASLDCPTLRPDSFGNPDNPEACYVIPDKTGRTWEEAVAFCAELNAGDYIWSLLEIKDFEELDYLTGAIKSSVDIEPWWIGQNDRTEEHVWEYLNTPSDCATTGVYLHWQDLQPNGETGDQDDQDCIAFFIDDPGFQDKACTLTYNTLCKTTVDSSKLSFAAISLVTDSPTTKSVTTVDPSLSYTECSSISSGAFSHPSDPSRCYRFSSMTGTYADATELCNKQGWDPANIEDGEENAIIFKTFQDTTPDITGYWIAQNDQVSENVWTYNDLSNCNGVYVNFDETERQPDGGASKNCAVMTAGNNGQWQDVSCDDTYNIMCKLQQESTLAKTTSAPSQVLEGASCSLPNCVQQWYGVQLGVSVTAVTSPLASIQTGNLLTCVNECLTTTACATFTLNTEEIMCKLYEAETASARRGFSVTSGSNYYTIR